MIPLYAAGVPGRAPWQRQELSQTAKDNINSRCCVSGMERQQCLFHHVSGHDGKDTGQSSCTCASHPLLGWVYPRSYQESAVKECDLASQTPLCFQKKNYLLNCLGFGWFCLFKMPGEGILSKNTYRSFIELLDKHQDAVSATNLLLL